MSLNHSDFIGRIRRNFQLNHFPGVISLRGSLFLLLLAISTFSSCKDELEVFEIIRSPVFSFSTDNLNLQNSTDVKFTKGKNTLHHYPTGENIIYTRCLMEVSGTNPAGKKYLLSVEFDLLQQDNYIGIYRPAYVIEIGGMYSFSYLEETSANVYISYNLDPGALDSAYFRIQKQSQEEKLILGDFYAKLQNDQKPAEKLIFYQGTFKDIYYAAQ